MTERLTVAQAYRSALLRAVNAEPDDIVWLTDVEAEAMREGRVIMEQQGGTKFIVMTDKGEMFGPFDSATAAFEWGVSIYPTMSWSIRPVDEARTPAVPRAAS